jgi:hypothetical protein
MMFEPSFSSLDELEAAGNTGVHATLDPRNATDVAYFEL